MTEVVKDIGGWVIKLGAHDLRRDDHFVRNHALNRVIVHPGERVGRDLQQIVAQECAHLPDNEHIKSTFFHLSRIIVKNSCFSR